MTYATKTFVYWTYSGDTMLGRLIAWATDGPWCHMGIGFELNNGARERYEALKNSGFAGPKPYETLIEFGEENPKRRMLVAYTDFGTEISEALRQLCRSMVGQLSYNTEQLAFMALSERYRFPVPRSPDRTVCSEAVSRVLEPHIELRDARRKTHDMVNPNSAWRRYVEVRSGYGAVTAPPAGR